MKIDKLSIWKYFSFFNILKKQYFFSYTHTHTHTDILNVKLFIDPKTWISQKITKRILWQNLSFLSGIVFDWAAISWLW